MVQPTLLTNLRGFALRAALRLIRNRAGARDATAHQTDSPVKTIFTLLFALLLAGGAHAQAPAFPAFPATDAFTVTSNALQTAIAKGDTNRITMLSNALLRITGQAAARPVIPAAAGVGPAGAQPVARPANPIVAPANPAGAAPPVAGAVAPGAGGGVDAATAGAVKAAAAITGDPDEVVFQPGMLKLKDADIGSGVRYLSGPDRPHHPAPGHVAGDDKNQP